MAERTAEMFPKLTDAQIERLREVSHERAVHAGEILFEQGDSLDEVLGGRRRHRSTSCIPSLAGAADRGSRAGKLHRRDEHARRDRRRWFAVARAGRGACSRSIVGALRAGRRGRRRSQRDDHARVHPASRRADRRRAGRRGAARLAPLGGDAARARVLDSQRPSARDHRRRARSDGAGAARSVQASRCPMCPS